MTNALWWPRTLLSPRRAMVDLMNAGAQSTGRAITGKEQAVAPDAGYWKIVYDEIPLASPDQKRAWRGLEALLQGRRNTIAVPIYDFDNVPNPPGQSKPQRDRLPFQDADVLSNALEMAGNVVVATAAVDALQGAYQVSITVTTGGTLQIGTHFSAQDILYRITKISGTAPYLCNVTPPLRQDIDLGASLNFDDPRCTVRLATDREMQTGMDDYAGRATAKLNFVEACGEPIILQPLVPYTTGAVHFDGSTGLKCNSLSVPGDNLTCSASFWIRVAVLGSTQDAFLMRSATANFNAFDLDGFGSAGTWFLGSFGGPADTDVYVYNDSKPVPWNDGGGTWHHVLLSADGTRPRYRLYIDRVAVDVDEESADFPGSGPTFQFNGNPMTLFYDPFGPDDTHINFTGDIADWWIAPGQSLLDIAGEIPPETIAKFCNALGKPVDLGADGSAPTGVAPSVFLRRAPAADPTTFVTNLGNGGAFATEMGAVLATSSSPSD